MPNGPSAAGNQLASYPRLARVHRRHFHTKADVSANIVGVS